VAHLRPCALAVLGEDGRVVGQAQCLPGRGVPAGSGPRLVVGDTREQNAALKIGQRRAGVELAQPLPGEREQLRIEQAEHDQAGLQAAYLRPVQ